MFIHPTIVGAFPKAAKYLKKDLPAVVQVPAIMHAITSISGLSASMVRALLLNEGNVPIARLVDEEGEDQRDFVVLNTEADIPELVFNSFILMLFEGGYDLRGTRSGKKVHRLGACTLAALATYGKQGTEGWDDLRTFAANDFVKKVYGWTGADAHNGV